MRLTLITQTLLLVAALLFINLQVHAQDNSVNALYQGTQDLTGEIAQLQAEAKTLTGARKASLQLRISERQLELLAAFDTLSNRIIDAENNGALLTDVKAKLAPQLLALGPLIKAAINERLAALDNLQDDHEELSVEWMSGYLEHNRFIDHAYQKLTLHAKNLGDLDLNNNDSNAYLHQALQQRAEVLAGQIALTENELKAHVQSLAASPDEAATKQKVKSLEDKQKITTESLKNTVDLLQANGLDSGRYKEILVSSTGDITADILDINLLKRLSQSWLKNITDYALENGVGVFFKLIVFLLILVFFHYLSRTTAKLLRASLAKSTVRVSSLMETMVINLCRHLIMLIGVLLGLSQLGFSLAPILAGLGVAGFIVGFALQDTLGNFASGLMILIYRPYDVNDLIEAAGVQGRVQRMNLVSTTILTIDNQTLVIPNNKIWGDVIRNVTAQKHRRVDMVFGIGYGDDIEKAEQILKRILDEHPQVLAEPEHTVKLHTLNESSVDFVVRPWVETENYWDVYWDVTKSVKLRFDAEGISIPFPQRDVHIYQTEKTA